ncbi:MAG: thioredoxin family protein [Bacteroidales bacterium]|nr:thioredoxin family protein [Bacteroidales bacterium]
MKFRLLITMAFLAGAGSLFAQNVNTLILDTKKNTNILVGYCNEAGLEKGEFGVYFKSQYETYAPKEKTIEKLKKKIGDYSIKIVFGSWCSDSQLQVPRFYKILDVLDFQKSKLEIIGVDRNKNALVVNIKDLKIEFVPTFIVYKYGKEVGRIVETPVKSLEDDLLNIIGK